MWSSVLFSVHKQQSFLELLAMAMAVAFMLPSLAHKPLSLSLCSSFSGCKLPSSVPAPPLSMPAPRLPLLVEAKKKIRGKVVSAVNDKTVSVEVVRIYKHPKYKKRIKSSKKYHAHDPENSCKVGDIVTLIQCAPVSKTKTFRVAEIAQSRPSPVKLGEELLPPLEPAAAV